MGSVSKQKNNTMAKTMILKATRSCGVLLLLTQSLSVYSNNCNLATSSPNTLIPDELQHCWYGLAELGYSRLDPDAKTAGWRVTDDSDTSLSIAAGWRFWPKWFAEFKYADQGDAKIRNGSASARIDYVTSSLMLGYDLYAINESLQFYVKAGFATIDESVKGSSSISVNDSNGLEFVSGAGLEYRWNNPWFARMNVDIYNQDLQTLGFSIGRYFTQSSTNQSISKARADIESRQEMPSIEIRESEAEVIIHAPLPKNEPEAEPIKAMPVKAAPLRNQQNRVRTPSKEKTAIRTSSDCASLAGIMENIQFDSNSSYLKPAGKAQLKEYAMLIKRYPQTSILISAHTDSSGDDNYNQHMSEKRARRVKDYLVSLGINAEQLDSKGTGEQKPIATNNTEEGRAANRRVEFTIVSSDICIE